MKKCGSCHTVQDKTEFYKNSAKKDGLSSYCKKCNTLWVRKRYLRNKIYYDDKNKEARKRNQSFLLNFLKENPCIDCGEKDPVVLEFDHIGSKKRTISHMVRALCCLDAIESEIKKCCVRCANCHRRRHAKEKSWFKFIGE